MPLLTSTFAPEKSLIMFVPGTSLLFLALLGALAAGAGGAGLGVGAIRGDVFGAHSPWTDRRALAPCLGQSCEASC